MRDEVTFRYQYFPRPLMAETNRYFYSTVGIDELKDGMTILAYTRFGNAFTPLTDTSCRFIKHNFKNAKAVILRSNHKLDLPIEDVKSGDTLIRLHSFPAELKKLMVVTEKLSYALKRRGFLEFDVRQQGLEKSAKKELKSAIDLVKLATQKSSEKKNSSE